MYLFCIILDLHGIRLVLELYRISEFEQNRFEWIHSILEKWQSQMLYFIAQISWCISIIAILNKIVKFFQVFSESLDKIVK